VQEAKCLCTRKNVFDPLEARDECIPIIRSDVRPACHSTASPLCTTLQTSAGGHPTTAHRSATRAASSAQEQGYIKRIGKKEGRNGRSTGRFKSPFRRTPTTANLWSHQGGRKTRELVRVLNSFNEPVVRKLAGLKVDFLACDPPRN